MPDRPWKAFERHAAALFGRARFKANTGGALDFETDGYVEQVKHVKRLSLAELEALALEMERIGVQKSPPRMGVVVVKRRAGRGRKSPRLVVVTEAVWRELNGAPSRARQRWPLSQVPGEYGDPDRPARSGGCFDDPIIEAPEEELAGLFLQLADGEQPNQPVGSRVDADLSGLPPGHGDVGGPEVGGKFGGLEPQVFSEKADLRAGQERGLGQERLGDLLVEPQEVGDLRRLCLAGGAPMDPDPFEQHVIEPALDIPVIFPQRDHRGPAVITAHGHMAPPSPGVEPGHKLDGVRTQRDKYDGQGPAVGIRADRPVGPLPCPGVSFRGTGDPRLGPGAHEVLRCKRIVGIGHCPAEVEAHHHAALGGESPLEDGHGLPKRVRGPIHLMYLTRC